MGWSARARSTCLLRPAAAAHLSSSTHGDHFYPQPPLLLLLLVLRTSFTVTCLRF